MKRLAVFLAIAALVAAPAWALQTAAIPPTASVPGTADRGPEPATMALGALGLLAIGAAWRRRT